MTKPSIYLIDKVTFLSLLRCWVHVTLINLSLTAIGLGIELGQIDDFDAGVSANWIWGRDGFGGPVVVADPSVSENAYLETESFGGEDAPGSRMALINREQWTGDFLAAGVSAIRLEAFNGGPNFAFQDMTIRLGFSSELASTGSGRVVTSQGFPVNRDDGWQQLEFDLNDLTPIAGSDPVEVMRSVSEMRIISAEDPLFIGDQFIARLGVDSITAVPEPSAASHWLGGVIAVFLWFRLQRVSG